MNKIQIPLSKTKILLTISASILFIVLGIYAIAAIADQQKRYHPIVVKVAGAASICFFGAVGIYGVRKMFNEHVGLTIDDDGIIDHTNASSIGLIRWENITEIRVEQIRSTKFLLIYTNNPDEIINRATGFKRMLINGNMNMYGTPLSITATMLKYRIDDLETLLHERLNKYRERISS